jgi:hypothetical protein
VTITLAIGPITGNNGTNASTIATGRTPSDDAKNPPCTDGTTGHCVVTAAGFGAGGADVFCARAGFFFDGVVGGVGGVVVDVVDGAGVAAGGSIDSPLANAALCDAVSGSSGSAAARGNTSHTHHAIHMRLASAHKPMCEGVAARRALFCGRWRLSAHSSGSYRMA